MWIAEEMDMWMYIDGYIMELGVCGWLANEFNERWM